MNQRACHIALSSLFTVALAACAPVPHGGGGGSGGASAASSSTSSSATAGSTSASSSSASSSSGPGCAPVAPLTGPCAPKPSCTANGSVCLAHLDQSASTTPGFRIAQLDIVKPPPPPAQPPFGGATGSATPSDVACNLYGSGTFSWLLRFDTAAGTLETGGAKPVQSGPYSFADEMVTWEGYTFHAHPVTAPASLSATCTFDAVVGDLNLPIYLDLAAMSVVVLPLRSVHFHDAAVSADRGCIGRYNAAGLDPASACLPDSTHPTFLDAAVLDAFIVLEDADRSLIASLNESLCVALSGDSSTYGTKNAAGVTVCKRDASNKILYPGDWCAATNAVATPSCSDSVQLVANFAAQAVPIQ